MKIKNSTQWSNLYSNASKYNINVRDSQYKRAVYSVIGVFTSLIILVSFTFHYGIALLIAIISIISLSLFLSISRLNRPITSSLTLTKVGVVEFSNDQVIYQLLPESRLSFFGCWLVLGPSENTVTQHSNPNKKYPKQLFIFKDSLHAQDFSRLASVINQLG